MYTTYRRANLRSRFLSALYNVLFLACIVVVLPVYIIALHGHLDVDTGGRGYVTARLANPEGDIACTKDVLGNGTACSVWDWLETVTVRGKDMFITTFVQEELQVRTCGRREARCAAKTLWKTVNRTEYYTAGPEKFRMLVEHKYVSQGETFSVRSAEGVVVRNTVDVHARDVESGSDSSSDAPPAVVPTLTQEVLVKAYDCEALRSSLDFAAASRADAMELKSDNRTDIKVSHMVKAAGMHMKHRLHHAPPDLAGLNATLRRWGSEFHVDIFYSNLWRSGVRWESFFEEAKALVAPGVPRYQVCVTANPSPDPARTITTHAASPYFADAPPDPEGRETRVRRRAYGLRVQLNVDGRIGRFSWLSLAVFMVSALVLLNVPFTLVENLLYLPVYTRRSWYTTAPGAARPQRTVFCSLIECDDSAEEGGGGDSRGDSAKAGKRE